MKIRCRVSLTVLSKIMLHVVVNSFLDLINYGDDADSPGL